MVKNDYSERIKKQQEIIEKSKTIISKEQEKIKKANEEIKKLQELEIKGLINEVNIPYSELKELLKKYKK